MTDRTFESSEVISESSNVNIPEVVDEMPDPALLSENASLIDKTIFFINRTISGKAIETALVIGGHINLTTRQLDYRVRMQAMETEYFEDELPMQNPSEKVVEKLLAAMKPLARKASSLNIESLDPLLGHISGNTRTMFGKGLMALADEMDKTQIACETLSQKIRQMETEY